VNPATEIIDATNLPKADVTYDANGKPVSDVKITPIANAADGTQLWRITHNGVDTHPIHFHLYDVQLVNRVTWDNIIIPTEANELGWKDTVRVAPLEDTIVALRPIIPEIPWELPNAIRMLNPMMPAGSPAMFNNIDPQGDPVEPGILNQLVNFGWEYVYHCHILSHEEMDMMRPVSVALPPVKPDGLAAEFLVNANSVTVKLTWNDKSIAETAYLVQRMAGASGAWVDIGTIASPLDQVNTTGPLTLMDTTAQLSSTYQYRVVAQNTVGYGGAFPATTAASISDALTVNTPLPTPPAAPTGLAATAISATQVNLTWTDNANDETGFRIERCSGVNCANFAPLGGVAANTTAYSDLAAQPGTTYSYRVFAFSQAGDSLQASNVATVTTPALGPAAPTNLNATLLLNPFRAQLTWTDNSNNENLFRVFRSTNGGTFTQIATVNRSNNQRNAVGGTVNYTNNLPGGAAGNTYAYYVIAVNTQPNPDQLSAPSNTVSVTVVLPTPPAAPTNLTGAAVRINGSFTQDRVTLNWVDASNNETGFQIQRSTSQNFNNANTYNVGANVTTFNQNVSRAFNYYYRVRAVNAAGNSAWSNVQFVTTP
jgi:fibronectin type 3 domain-containing protein